MGINMTCGIYLGAPNSADTDKVYIGQSTNIESRIIRHTSSMLRGEHTKKIQEAYSKYGPFSWEVIKECDEDELDEYEEYYIKVYNAYTDGFNSYQNSHSAPILYGLEHGRVTDELAQTYKNILDLTITNPIYSRYKVSEVLGIEPYIVSHVWYAPEGFWLAKEFPVEYESIQDLRGTRKLGGATASQQGIIYPRLLNSRLESFSVDNVRNFAREHSLDKGDLSKLLNKKKPYTKGWIIQDLDIIAPGVHNKFYSCINGKYKVQFDLYTQSKE